MMSASVVFSGALSSMLSSARKRSRWVRTAREKASVSPVVRPTSRIRASRSRKSLASLLRSRPCRAAASMMSLRRRCGGGGARPGVYELHLQQRGRGGERGNDPLALGEANLDGEARAVGTLAWIHVGRDPLAVA